MRNLCRTKRIYRSQNFIERGESAKNLNRTQLKNLIRYAKDNYNNIDVLIIYKIDRLSRNQRIHRIFYMIFGIFLIFASNL
ncbi:MAG: recombinase family protein [bacterium]|nr:recombinase family protein [bacterium]